MRTEIAKLLGTTVLGGALQGRAALGKLIEKAQSRPVDPTAWLWDFKGVEVVSASFIRESFLSMQALLRGQRSTLIPVVANVSADVREDLRLMLKDAGKAIVTCSCNDRGRVTDVGLIGALDAQAEATFAMVLERGETDAKELTEAQGGDRKIGQTGWNNRLASLVELGVVIEVPVGRAKRYRPVVQEG